MRDHVASHDITAEDRTIHTVANDVHDVSRHGVTISDHWGNVLMYVPADLIRKMDAALTTERISTIAERVSH